MNLENITTDLLVVDYTEYHQRHPEEEIPSKGVHFIEQPDNRLGAFYILNPQQHPFEVINLETTPQLVTNESGELVKQCECICRAHREKGKRRWILLLELKYCIEDNIPVNMQNALLKLEKCYDFLVDKQFFADCPYKVYLGISHPEHDTIKPFGEFINNQDRLLGLNEKGVQLLYCNAIKILTPEYLAKTTDVPRRYRST